MARNAGDGGDGSLLDGSTADGWCVLGGFPRIREAAVAQHLGGGTGGPEAGREAGSPGRAKAGQGKGEEKGSFRATVEGGKRSWKGFAAMLARFFSPPVSFDSEAFAAVIFSQREQGFSPEKVSATASPMEPSCE